MKKFLVVLLFSICHLSMQALIGKYTLNSQHKDSADNVSQPYELIVSEPNDNNEILINFGLNQVNIIPNSLQHGKELVLIDGFDQTLIAEEPALPVRNISNLVKLRFCRQISVTYRVTFLPPFHLMLIVIPHLQVYCPLRSIQDTILTHCCLILICKHIEESTFTT